MSLHDSNSSIGEEDFSTLFDDDIIEQLDLETVDEQRIVYQDVEAMAIGKDEPQSAICENDFVVVKFTYTKERKMNVKRCLSEKLLRR